jgi:hypothetical protein
MVFGITCALGAIFFAFISQSIEGLVAGAAAFAFFMFLFVIIAAIIDLFGGFHVRFALTDAGVRSMSGKYAKATAGVAFWAGVLSGKPGLAGAGALAQAEQGNRVKEFKHLSFVGASEDTGAEFVVPGCFVAFHQH